MSGQQREREPLPLFVAIANYGIAMGAAPLNKHVGCWEQQVDASWWLAVNGHRTPTHTSRGGEPIPPFTAYVEYNGWPAGLIGPADGAFAAGTGANETAFLVALANALPNAVAAGAGPEGGKEPQ